MKIGIITHSLIGNYGGILQNFALQQALKKLGHSPITVDYLPYTTNLLVNIKNTIKYILSFVTLKHPRYNPYRLHRSSLFDSFVQKNINLTKAYSKHTLSIVTDNKLDVLITGSDQVWRPSYVTDIDAMYLGFAESSSVAYSG